MVFARIAFSIWHPPMLSFTMSDSERYYYSGLFFAQTGQICYPVPTKSAWIMPGITVLLGALARVFHAFIPLTYSAGDPVYEGSFIGEGIPSEEEILSLEDDFDPEAYVVQTHPDLFDAQGNPVDDVAEQYAHHLYLAAAGKQRLRQWFRLHPLLFLKSYLYIKPKALLNDVWYWDQVFGISLNAAVRLRQVNLALCLLAGLLSVLRRKLLRPVWYLGVTYVVNLYIVASSLPLDRYGQAIMPYRLVLGAIGLYLLADTLRKGKRAP